MPTHRFFLLESGRYKGPPPFPFLPFIPLSSSPLRPYPRAVFDLPGFDAPRRVHNVSPRNRPPSGFCPDIGGFRKRLHRPSRCHSSFPGIGSAWQRGTGGTGSAIALSLFFLSSFFVPSFVFEAHISHRQNLCQLCQRAAIHGISGQAIAGYGSRPPAVSRFLVSRKAGIGASLPERIEVRKAHGVPRPVPRPSKRGKVSARTW
jgi:hypothetical protein